MFGADGDESSRGSAHVYRFNGSTWVEEQKLTASDGEAGEVFGRSVSVAEGGVALIGAFFEDENGAEPAATSGVFPTRTRYKEPSSVAPANLFEDLVPGNSFRFVAFQLVDPTVELLSLRTRNWDFVWRFRKTLPQLFQQPETILRVQLADVDFRF